MCVGVLVASLAGFGPAAARGDKHAAFMIDANTGAVLHQDDADELRHPASLTKMMTLYLTFETLASGRLAMTSPVVISQEAASVAPSKLDLDPGESISVRDAILALITKSANDVAVALAEKIGGNQTNFVRLMNAKARELGMAKTHFENPSGLPDPDQVTSARDMVTLGLRLQDDFPQYYPLFATRSFTYAGHSHRNHNTLMNNFAGIDGIKTGYTRASGFNLVSSVRRSGRHVVGAVFGGSSAASRNAEMRVLLTRALTRASTVKTRKPIAIAKLKDEPKRAERPEKRTAPKPVAVAEADFDSPPPKLAKAPAPAQRPKHEAAAPQRPSPAVPAATADVSAVARNNVANASRDAAGNGASEAVATAVKSTVSEVSEEAAAAPAAAPAPIALTKVKRIMVAPRVKPATAQPGPADTTDMEATDSSGVRETIVAKTSKGNGPLIASAETPKASTKASMLGAADLAQAQLSEPAAAPSNDAAETAAERAAVAAETPAPRTFTPAKVAPAPTGKTARPSSGDVTTASTNVAPAAKAKSAPSTPQPAAPVQRGKAPSSLAAQAAALHSGADPSGAGRVAEVTGRRGGGRFEIQIGAYDSVAEAQKALDAVHARAGRVVADHASVTLPVDKGGRQIYRARFRGFDANTAANACGALRQQAFDCFVMTAE